jgi:LysR family glycine cleavage system transcriptional activator
MLLKEWVLQIMTVISFHVILEILRYLMKRIHALIPNLTALRALVSLSETGSITKTAQALALTQSAVSHQMKTLQDVLGFAPIVRDGRGVRLSRRARDYVAEVAPALDVLARASGPPRATGELRINVAPGFAAYWLAPRLPIFTRANPDLRLHISSARGYGNLGSRDDDLYISFTGSSQVPNGALPLMSVEFFPVAEPSLLAGRQLKSVTDILDYPLLHLDGTDDWKAWMAHVGAQPKDTPGGVIFQDMLILQAALRCGQGISLGDKLTCADALRRGELIRLSSMSMTAKRSYWLIEGSNRRTAARTAFVEWVLETMRRENP